MAIKILIADDHALIRKVLRRHLEVEPDFNVAGEAVNGRDAVKQAEALLPDVVLMDISMPELDGIEATRLICQGLPQVKVLILSIFNSSEYCNLAMSSGARGYLLKESASEEVVAAIRTVMGGGRYLGSGMAESGA